MPYPFSFIRSKCRSTTWWRTYRTRCCIPRKKRDDTPTLRFDKFQRTYPCKHASEHVLRQTPTQSAHKGLMCEKTRNANTCRGQTLQNFMTTVLFQRANKKKKRNASKRPNLSTLHTITHTLKLLIPFSDTPVGFFQSSLILHDQTQRANKEHHNAHKSFDTAANAGGVKEKHR